MKKGVSLLFGGLDHSVLANLIQGQLLFRPKRLQFSLQSMTFLDLVAQTLHLIRLHFLLGLQLLLNGFAHV